MTACDPRSHHSSPLWLVAHDDHSLHLQRDEGRAAPGSPPLPEVRLLIVHVHVQVKPDSVDAFKAATLENARQSVREPGVVRFDVVQQEDDPTRFLLIEIYRTPDDPTRHKATAHYAVWRDAAEPMMAEPRRSVKYRALFPEPAGWERPGERPQ